MWISGPVNCAQTFTHPCNTSLLYRTLDEKNAAWSDHSWSFDAVPALPRKTGVLPFIWFWSRQYLKFEGRRWIAAWGGLAGASFWVLISPIVVVLVRFLFVLNRAQLVITGEIRPGLSDLQNAIAVNNAKFERRYQNDTCMKRQAGGTQLLRSYCKFESEPPREFLIALESNAQDCSDSPGGSTIFVL